MPVAPPKWNTQNYWSSTNGTDPWATQTQPVDPYAAQRAAAAGAAKGSAASSAAATAAGTAQQQAQYGTMAGASKAASMLNPNDPNVIKDPYTGQLRALTPAEISDRARAQGTNAGAASSLAANVAQGQSNSMANMVAMAEASKMGSMGFGAPKPPVAPTLPGYENPAATTIPYATWENLQPYFNPMYQMLLDSGSRQINSTAASAGMLGSSGTFEDVGDWAVRAGGQAYDSAVQNFMADRAGVYGIGSDLREFDWRNYTYQNQLGMNLYNAEREDYQSQLKDFYSMMLGLSGVGQDAAKTASGLTTDSATAMANLFMALAQMQSMGGMAQANNQADFMGGLVQLLPMLSKMGAGG